MCVLTPLAGHRMTSKNELLPDFSPRTKRKVWTFAGLLLGKTKKSSHQIGPADQTKVQTKKIMLKIKRRNILILAIHHWKNLNRLKIFRRRLENKTKILNYFCNLQRVCRILIFYIFKRSVHFLRVALFSRDFVMLPERIEPTTYVFVEY